MSLTPPLMTGWTSHQSYNPIDSLTNSLIDQRLGRIEHLLESILKRLMILDPDLLKLEKYESLRNAYEQYQMVDALLDDPTNDSN